MTDNAKEPKGGTAYYMDKIEEFKTKLNQLASNVIKHSNEMNEDCHVYRFDGIEIGAKKDYLYAYSLDPIIVRETSMINWEGIPVPWNYHSLDKIIEILKEHEQYQLLEGVKC